MEKEMMKITVSAVDEGMFNVSLELPKILVDGYKRMGKENELNAITQIFINNLNENFVGWYNTLKNVTEEVQ